MDKSPSHNSPSSETITAASSVSAEDGQIGNFTVPPYSMEVHMKTPPTIVWYWVIKQNISRLQDAVATERADRRLEFIFGFTGLAFGSIESAITTLAKVHHGEVPGFFEFIFTIAFFVSILGVFYFWNAVRSPKSSLDAIINEITEREYEANVTRPSSESGGSTTKGETKTIR